MLARMAWLNEPVAEDHALAVADVGGDDGQRQGKSSILRSPWLARTSWLRRA